jgi:hypothetical protein
MPPQFPATKVYYQNVASFADVHPDSNKATVFTFTRTMIAWPLTALGPPGSEPDNKAAWWPYFQARHKIQAGLYWVQGHLLNHKVHGPGAPYNLVPISNTTNTNMEAIIESFAKKHVDAGLVLWYQVNAHFDGPKALKNWPADILQRTQALAQALKNLNHAVPSLRDLAHPQFMRQAYGLLGSANQPGSLLWGEQFAPTRLSWELKQSVNWNTTPDWHPANHKFKGIARSDHISPDSWYNTFPQ